MFLSKRAICAVCTVLLAAGCASKGPVKPSYNDAQLRPINQDLVAWLRRLNINQPESASPVLSRRPSVQTHPIGQHGQNLIEPNRGAARDVTHVTLPATPQKRPTLSRGSASDPSTLFPVGAADLTAPSPPWVAPAGTSLRQTLTAWAARAGWTLIWEAKSAGPNAATRIQAYGDFVDALRSLIRAGQIAGAHYPCRVEAFPRQKIIHVTDKD